jgi:poly(A) polymerase
MWPGYLSVVEDLTERAISRFLRRCQNYSLALIILFLADRKATGLKWDTKTKERMRRIVDRYFYIPPVKVRLVSGYDIMEQYNLKPGPIIGRLLKLIEEAQEEGRVKTKEEALELIKPFVDAYHSSSSG